MKTEFVKELSKEELQTINGGEKGTVGYYVGYAFGVLGSAIISPWICFVNIYTSK